MMHHDDPTTAHLKQPHQEPLHLRQQHSLRRSMSVLAHFLFLLFLFSLTSCDKGVAAQRREKNYPLLSSIPDTTFSCRGHTAGYYADPETGCQVYHMCDTLEKQYSYLCPNHTLFNQKFMVCDHWYMVNCSSATSYYELNDHIGEVPNSSGNDESHGNAIGVPSIKGTSSSSLNTAAKEAKSTPVSFTFKAPGTLSHRSTIPTNSLVTVKPSFPPAAIKTTGFTSFTRDPLISFKTSTTQKPSSLVLVTNTQQKLTSTPRPVSTVRPVSTARPVPTTRPLSTVRPVSTARPVSSPTRFFDIPGLQTAFPSSLSPPSRFFQLPNVENPFSSIPNTLVKPKPPPSSFLQLPNIDLDDKSPSVTGDFFSKHSNSTVAHNLPFVQTPPPGTPFTMVPGVVARNPGNRFTFASAREKKPSIEELAFKDILFRPVVLRPKDKIRKVFTSAPASITAEPHHHVTPTSDQDIQHSTTTVFAAPLVNKVTDAPAAKPAGIRIPSVFLQPPPNGQVPTFFSPLQQTLIPPARVKQEFLTPLSMPALPDRTKSRHSFQLSNGIDSGTVQFHFPISRANRDFFIPSFGLSLPEEDSRTSRKDSSFDSKNSLIQSPLHEKKANMTMVFAAPRDAQFTTLQINPECPKCHPAFLRPGQCKPCVLIR